MVLFTASSVIEVIGFAVFTPAHDNDDGVEVSVNDVLFELPGKGAKAELVGARSATIPFATVEPAGTT